MSSKRLCVLSIVVLGLALLSPREGLSNEPFAGGQWVASWSLDDLWTVKETNPSGYVPEEYNFAEWLTERGYDAEDYVRFAVDVFEIEYHTTDPLEQKIKCSGRISIPRGVSDPMPILIWNHGTMNQPIVDHTIHAAVWASAGFIVLTPYYIGKNKSCRKEYHNYLMQESYGKVAEGMLRAGKAALDLNDVPYTDHVFITGISEGGYATLAETKYLQERGVSVTAAAPTGGIFSPSVMYPVMLLSDDYVANWRWMLTLTKWMLAGTFYHPEYLGPSIETAYGTESYERKVRTNCRALFRSPFHELFADALLDQAHTADLLAAAEEVYDALPAAEKEPLPWGVLEEEVKTYIRNNPFTSNSFGFALANDIHQGWTPQAPVRFYHGSEDVDIPPVFSLIAQQGLGAGNPDVTVEIFPGVTHFESILAARRAGTDWFRSLVAAGE